MQLEIDDENLMLRLYNSIQKANDAESKLSLLEEAVRAMSDPMQELVKMNRRHQDRQHNDERRIA